MSWLNQLHRPEKYAILFLKWALLGILTGLLGGLMGAGFHHALHFVTQLRSAHPWLIWLLPVGGLLSVGLYTLCHMTNNHGTNEIIDAVLEEKPINPLVAPVIFLTTGLTHLFGGSAGREGAALQIGGSVASFLGQLLHLNEDDRTTLIMAGMSAVFAGLFGTPLTACLFTMEFEAVGTIFSPALLPCYLAAFSALRISTLLGVHAETYPLTELAHIELGTAWKFVLLAVLVALLGIAMCYILHHAERLFSRLFPNPWIRIIVGAALLAILTFLVGDQRFNGAGMDMALQAVGGQSKWYFFLLKLLFTAITLAAGFKGGEIVPTFCVGATFGCLVGHLLGVDSGLAAALGLVGLFCSVTNSPLASIALSIEMFSGTNLHLFALICVICFELSGHSGLYHSQLLEFSKDSMAGRRKIAK